MRRAIGEGDGEHGGRVRERRVRVVAAAREHV